MNASMSGTHFRGQVRSSSMSDGVEKAGAIKQVFLEAGQVTEFLEASAFSLAKWGQYHQHDSLSNRRDCGACLIKFLQYSGHPQNITKKQNSKASDSASQVGKPVSPFSSFVRILYLLCAKYVVTWRGSWKSLSSRSSL